MEFHAIMLQSSIHRTDLRGRGQLGRPSELTRFGGLGLRLLLRHLPDLLGFGVLRILHLQRSVVALQHLPVQSLDGGRRVQDTEEPHQPHTIGREREPTGRLPHSPKNGRTVDC